MLARSVLVVIGAYLLGSVSFAYLIGRLRGVDIRKVGTRNVGGSNVWHTVGHLEGVVAAIADIGKGAVAVWAAKALGCGEWTVALTGVAVVAGHNWPVFLGFQGGRGIGASLGAMLVMTPKAMGVALIPFAVGEFTKTLALGVAIGMAILPIAAWAFGEPLPTIVACLILLAFMIIRRLTGIGVWEEIRRAEDKRRLIVNRLLYDNPQGRGYVPPRR